MLTMACTTTLRALPRYLVSRSTPRRIKPTAGILGISLQFTNPDIDLPEKELTQILRDFANWMYKSLETEYYYQTSDEACKETIEANDWEFTEDGHFNS